MRAVKVPPSWRVDYAPDRRLAQGFGKLARAQRPHMILLLLIAETSVGPLAERSQTQGRANVRIERGIQAGRLQWTLVPAEQRREVVRKRPDGTTETIRIVDYP